MPTHYFHHPSQLTAKKLSLTLRYASFHDLFFFQLSIQMHKNDLLKWHRIPGAFSAPISYLGQEEVGPGCAASQGQLRGQPNQERGAGAAG